MKKRILYTIIIFTTTIGLLSCLSKKNSQVYTTVEQMPEFPGGTVEMQRYIAENLKAPKTLDDPMMCSRTTVRFIVSKDGYLRNVEAIKNKECSLSDSLIKVINSMPRWTPGKHNGKTVDVYLTIPLQTRPK